MGPALKKRSLLGLAQWMFWSSLHKDQCGAARASNHRDNGSFDAQVCGIRFPNFWCQRSRLYTTQHVYQDVAPFSVAHNRGCVQCLGVRGPRARYARQRSRPCAHNRWKQLCEKEGWQNVWQMRDGAVELPMAVGPVVGPCGRFSSSLLPRIPWAKADVSISRCSIVGGSGWVHFDLKL